MEVKGSVKITTTVSEGCREPIKSLCVLEKEVWSAATDTICIWDSTTYMLKKEIKAHTGTVNCLQKISQPSEFSSRRLVVWSGSADGTIKLWDTQEYNNYSCLKTCNQDIGKSDPISCLGPVKDRMWNAAGNSIYIWDLLGAKCGRIDVEKEGKISSMVSTDFHVWVAVGKVCYVYPALSNVTKSVKPLRILPEASSPILTLLQLGDTVWCGDEGGDLTVWSSESFDTISFIKAAHIGPIHALISTKPEKKELEVWSSGADHTIRVWDGEHYVCTKALKQHDDTILTMAQVEQDKIWSGSHSLCVWNEEKNLAHNIRLLSYSNEDKYVGEVVMTEDEVVRHGRGELHCSSGEIYVGTWQDDERVGYGIATYANKDKYYGYWQADERWGHGVYIHNDGSCFEGTWKNGKRKGLGTLLVPNGDRIEGEWKGDNIIRGKFTKGATSKLPKCVQELFLVHNEMGLQESRDKITRILPFHKWKYFAVANVKEVERRLKEKFPTMRITLKDLSILLNDESHPLGQSISDFSYMFNASYHFSYGEERTLLSNALDDVHSFLKGMELTIATLMPNIKQNDCVILMSNIVFTKIYHSLISLYREVNKHKDSLLNVKIHSLSGISLQNIGVRDKFWITSKDSNVPPYNSSIQKLMQLGDQKTISKKLRCLIEASKAIMRSVDEFHRPHLRMDRLNESEDESEESKDTESESEDGDGLAMGAGDKFPILLFCLLKVNIPYLFSEIAFLKEFADPAIYREEAQYRLIELEQALTYLQTLDWNVFDEEGVLVSISFLEKRVIEALKGARQMFFAKVKEFPRLLWLAEILLIAGTHRENDGDSPVVLDSVYNKYLNEEAYMKLAKQVFSAIGITFEHQGIQESHFYTVEFKHSYPQHIYTKLATLLGQEIQQLSYL